MAFWKEITKPFKKVGKEIGRFAGRVEAEAERVGKRVGREVERFADDVEEELEKNWVDYVHNAAALAAAYFSGGASLSFFPPPIVIEGAGKLVGAVFPEEGEEPVAVLESEDWNDTYDASKIKKDETPKNFQNLNYVDARGNNMAWDWLADLGKEVGTQVAKAGAQRISKEIVNDKPKKVSKVVSATPQTVIKEVQTQPVVAPTPVTQVGSTPIMTDEVKQMLLVGGGGLAGLLVLLQILKMSK